MKKLFLMLLACLIVTVGCSIGKANTLNEISFTEYANKIENKESFVLFIGAASCSHCTEYKRTLRSVLSDYDVTINYIDIDAFATEERNKFNSMVKYGGTPTTVFYTNGVEEHPSYNRINGSRAYSEVVKALKKNGYIKED